MRRNWRMTAGTGKETATGCDLTEGLLRSGEAANGRASGVLAVGIIVLPDDAIALYGLSSRISHDLAKSQSRLTVRAEIRRTSAVSSSLNPPK